MGPSQQQQESTSPKEAAAAAESQQSFSSPSQKRKGLPLHSDTKRPKKNEGKSCQELQESLRAAKELLRKERINSQKRIAKLELKIESLSKAINSHPQNRGENAVSVRSGGVVYKKNSIPLAVLQDEAAAARKEAAAAAKREAADKEANAIKQKDAEAKARFYKPVSIPLAVLQAEAAAARAAAAGKDVTSNDADTVAKGAAAAATASEGPYKVGKANPARDISFEERFQQLVDFKRANGHCRPKVREFPWVNRIRQVYHSSYSEDDPIEPMASSNRLDRDRVRRLEELGFDWRVGPPNVPWNKRFAALVAYKEEHGNTLVPRSHAFLGEWVHDLRRGRATMKAERRAKLDSIDFSWSAGTSKTTFEERLEECRNFRRKHGHLNPPNYPAATNKEEYSFLRWVQRIRKGMADWNAGKKSCLDNSRIKKLKEIGFNFDPPARRPPTKKDTKKEEVSGEQLLENLLDL